MASDLPESLELTLAPEDNERLRNLCGQLDEHLRQVERRLGIEISNRGSHFRCYGERAAIAAAGQVLQDLYRSRNRVSRACCNAPRAPSRRPRR